MWDRALSSVTHIGSPATYGWGIWAWVKSQNMVWVTRYVTLIWSSSIVEYRNPSASSSSTVAITCQIRKVLPLSCQIRKVLPFSCQIKCFCCCAARLPRRRAKRLQRVHTRADRRARRREFKRGEE